MGGKGAPFSLSQMRMGVVAQPVQVAATGWVSEGLFEYSPVTSGTQTRNELSVLEIAMNIQMASKDVQLLKLGNPVSRRSK